MTKKKLSLIGSLLILCLLVCLSVACAPVSEGPAEESVATVPSATTGNATREYSIEIKNEGDQPLEEIGVYIYADSSLQELVWFAKTDANGKLSFKDAASDSFVAVLTNVPAGYLVEENYPLTGENTKIVLEAGLMEGDLSTLNYKLGDLMMDFTAVAPDGKEYKFSELLKEKKAIVLNFWYLQCEPCKSEFPYLQEAYQQYDEDVIVLAMNPVNTEDAEIAQFQKEKGYTFPMMKCDPAWEKAMGISAYPTTVVIDRFGNICMIHTGSITEAETFETMFSFFTEDDYQQTFVKDMDELEEEAGVEQTVGTKDNPVEMGVTASFQMTIGPGHEMYYNFYRITGTLYLTVSDKDISVLYNGKTYNSPCSIPITSEGTSALVPVVFTNNGKETKNITVTMGRAAGTYGNPYTLSLEEFTTDVAAGNESGVYYTYIAEKTGLFKVSVLDVSPNVNYNIVAYNQTSYALRNSQDDGTTGESGYKSVSVSVSAGDRIQVIVGTLPDSSNTYPAASFELKAEILEGQQDTTEEEKLVSYSVNVTDENRKPVSNVSMNMKVADSTVNLRTNEEGFVVSKQKPGSYQVVLSVPNGYTARTTEFTLSEQYPSVSVMLDEIIVEKETYTVKVLDTAGQPISGATVTIGTGIGKTDASGVATITVAKDTYTAQIRANGYEDGEIQVSPENKSVQITLAEGVFLEMKDYTVSAVDYYGNPVSGVTLSFLQDGAAVDIQKTDSNGAVAISLPEGAYQIGVPVGWYTNAEKAVITEENSSVTICLIKGVSGEVGSVYENETDILQQGATYVDRIQSNTDNYFLFVPQEAGLYQFSSIESNAAISYWANNIQFLQNQSQSLNTDKNKDGSDLVETYFDAAANTFVANIKPANLGSTYVISLTGDTEAVVIIKRIGDAILDITDVTPTAYEAKCTIETDFRLNLSAGETLEYVDIKGKTAKVVRDSKGYYHMNSVDGPQLYVNLGESAPYFNLCEAMAVVGENNIYRIVEDFYKEDGTPDYRIEYNACLKKYCQACVDNPYTDLHPLNDDLVHILQRASEIKSWGVYDHLEYLFKDADGNKISGVNEENAWLFACCYVD